MNSKIKHIGRLIVFFAGLVILSHAVVPHHHHDGMVCTASSHCANDTKPHDDNTDEHSSDANDHQHDGGHNVQSCFLIQFIPNQNNHAERSLKCGNCDINIPLLIFATFPNNQSLFAESTDFSCFPVIQTGYSVFVSKCFGLRAPPIV
ncbi:MAG: hypothetical protein PF489_13610 [Salinivirgaceae bacterium]|nr:hypothetical protein [Salinivirgaceae bacterium]